MFILPGQSTALTGQQHCGNYKRSLPLTWPARPQLAQTPCARGTCHTQFLFWLYPQYVQLTFESAGRHLAGLHYVLTTRGPIKSFYQEVLSCILCIFFAGTLVDVGSSTSCCHPNGWWYSWGVSESSWGQREQQTEAAQTRDGGNERSRLRADVKQENDNVAMVTKQVPETFQASRV